MNTQHGTSNDEGIGRTPAVAGAASLALLCLSLCVAFCFASARAGAAVLPSDDQYVVVRDGHLTLGGPRIRFWGAVGNFPARKRDDNDPHADNEAVADRLKAMGFNMVRYWRGNPEPVQYVKGDGSPADLTDHFLWCLKKRGMHVWCAAMGGAVGKTPALPADAGVIDDAATAEAWKQAVATFGETGMPLNGRQNLARTWDRRLEAMAIRRMQHCANHVNPYTRLRWADDPVVAIWELHNEEWWFKRMNQGAFQHVRLGGKSVPMPEFFLRELLEQWNAFLKNKYGTEAALKRAWLGLLPGESLEAGTILLLPVETPIDPAPQVKTLGVTFAVPQLNPDGLRLLRTASGAIILSDGSPTTQPTVTDLLKALKGAVGDRPGDDRREVVILIDDSASMAAPDTQPAGRTREEQVREDFARPAKAGEAPPVIALPPDANPESAEPPGGMAEREYGPADFNGARASDVIEFLLKIWISHKQREQAAVKPLGKSTRLCPLVWDTGVGNEMQSQWLHQHADAVAHCEYQQGIHWDPKDKRFPWHSMLEETPRLSPNREWETVEHPRMPGKPFLLYENQIHNPAKYRAEYPMLVASLASIQDWDAVVWHYFGVPPDARDPRPYERRLDYSSSEFGHPQGFHYQFDEVQMSSMRAAAAIFRGSLLKPAPDPTWVIFGRKALHSLDMIHWGEAGNHFLPTTYRYGVRVLIDPALEDSPEHALFRRWGAWRSREAKDGYEQFMRDGWLAIGPTYYNRYYEPNPYAPTGEITYDRQKGHLTFDAAGVAMYVGFYAQHGGPVSFDGSGVRLRDVVIQNPDGIAYPVTPEERFLEFALVATEPTGVGLKDCRRAMISAVSTSFNKGFELDHSKMRGRFWWDNKGATRSLGGLPVLVARVGATVEGQVLAGMGYRLLDWHLREIGSGKVAAGTLRIPADKPVFLVELER